MNNSKNKGSAGHFDECHAQLALFNIAPTYRTKIVHDPYWDEIVKPAPEHCGDNEGSALLQNSTPLQESVREQFQPLESAPEHTLSNEGSALLQNSTPLQESVREQLESLESAPEHIEGVDIREELYFVIYGRYQNEQIQAQHEQIQARTAKQNNETVREQLESLESAPEHCGDIEGSALTQNSTPLQESVREQFQSLKSAPEHCGDNDEDEAPQKSTLLHESFWEQLPSTNFNQYPYGKEKPENKQNTHWIEQYWVKRGNRKHFYYRYCWMIGRKICKVHLGSVSSNNGKLRRREVLELIDAGATPTKIVEYVKKSNNSRK